MQTENETAAQSNSTTSVFTSDRGPWCLGIPSVETRPFTNSERLQALDALLKQFYCILAWLLPLPVATIAVVLRDHNSSDAPGLTLPVMFELALALGLLVAQDNPIRRCYLAVRDCRFGRMQQFAGAFESTKYEAPQDIFDSNRTRQHRRDIERVIARAPGSQKSICRLPLSGRLFSVNGPLYQHWLEVEVSDARIARPLSRAGSSFAWGDGTFFILLVIGFATAIVNDIWSPPWYFLILTFCSFFVCALWIVKAIETRSSIQ